MRLPEKCRNNSDNPLTSRRTDGGKNGNVITTSLFGFSTFSLSTNTNIVRHPSRNPNNFSSSKSEKRGRNLFPIIRVS